MSSRLQFPEELTQRSQWCLWRIEPDKKGRPTKVPYRVDGRKASSTDRTTWGPFTAAAEVLLREPETYRGVGYFFAPDDSACGIDLDVSLDDCGNPHPWAVTIIDRFSNTYRALSSSGRGLHIVCCA